MTQCWFFVYEGEHALAAFPEMELAESYCEGTPWEIRQKLITHVFP